MRPAAYMRSSTSMVRGEEVELLLRLLRDARRREEHGLVVEVGDGRALRLLREAAGFEADGAGAEPTVVDDGFGERDLRTFQEVSLLCLTSHPVWARLHTSEQEQAGRTASRSTCSRWPPVEVHRTLRSVIHHRGPAPAGLLRTTPARTAARAGGTRMGIRGEPTSRLFPGLARGCARGAAVGVAWCRGHPAPTHLVQGGTT